MAKELKIGNKVLGPGHPAFVVAEISGNHGGDIERALDIVRAAKRAGADAVKLQTYTADTITINCDREDFQLPSDSPWSAEETLYQLYAKAQTPWEWHSKLFEEARLQNIIIFSSPFDESAVDLLEKLNAPAYKIASPEITHIPLIRRVARTGKPVILSTGISELSDVELAIETLRSEGATQIIVLKCTTAYPAPAEESNLRTIPDIVQRFGVLSGLSDHTLGSAGAIAAVVLGGSLIEKHFTLDGQHETVDSFFSSNENEFRLMVQDIRLVEASMGCVSYDIALSARNSFRGRRSLYVAAPIRAGETLTTDNVKCVRPSFGLHPKHLPQILGRKATCDLLHGDRLTWDVISAE
jgi:pseudaminic acid synthase